MKVIYEAEDGTKFDTAEQCKSYESVDSQIFNDIDKLWLASPFNCVKFIVSNIDEINRIINKYKEVKSLNTNKQKSSEVKPKVDWNKVPVGTSVRARDSELFDWIYGTFISYNKDVSYPFEIRQGFEYEGFLCCELV